MRRMPIAPESINAAIARMDVLPAADKARLVSLGLAGDEEYDDTGKGMKHHLIPLWTVKDSYYWSQRFPAGRDLAVDHRYVPGTGGQRQERAGVQDHAQHGRGPAHGRAILRR
jgi:hypothetical protein